MAMVVKPNMQTTLLAATLDGVSHDFGVSRCSKGALERACMCSSEAGGEPHAVGLILIHPEVVRCSRKSTQEVRELRV